MKAKVLVTQTEELKEYTPHYKNIWVVEYDPDVNEDPQTLDSPAIVGRKLVAYAEDPTYEGCYASYDRLLDKAYKLAARIEAANEEGKQLSGCPSCSNLVVTRDKRPCCDRKWPNTPLQSLDWNKGEITCSSYENNKRGLARDPR